MPRMLMAVALSACVAGLVAHLWLNLRRVVPVPESESADSGSAGPRLLPEMLQGFALLLLAASILLRLVQTGQAPFATTQEFASTFAWGVMASSLAFGIRLRRSTWLVSVTGLTIVVVLLGWVVADYPQPRSLVPALQNNLLFVSHVGVAVAAYGSLAVAFGAAVGTLIARTGQTAARSTIGQTMDALCYRAAKIGFVLLTLTILLGSIWADVAWGSFWSWDPKETAALLTWLVFAGYFHARLLAGWRGKKAALLVVIGFLAVVITFLGNFVFPGLHSYN